MNVFMSIKSLKKAAVKFIESKPIELDLNKQLTLLNILPYISFLLVNIAQYLLKALCPKRDLN